LLTKRRRDGANLAKRRRDGANLAKRRRDGANLAKRRRDGSRDGPRRMLHSASFPAWLLVRLVPVSKVTLFIPSLLPPPADTFGEAPMQRYPALEQIVARGHASSADCSNSAAWLCESFGVRKQLDWPAAPISLQGEGGDPGRSFWLCANPVHLQVQRDQLVLTPPASLSISETESRSLIETLNRHFAADGLVFVAPDPQRWYLRMPSFPDLHTVALEDAVGRDINHLLPSGNDRMHYHGLFNEVQMLLHAHPVNEARDEAGIALVNSVWFWGGGTLPPAIRSPWTQLVGDSPLLRGLGRLADVPVASLAKGSDFTVTTDALVVLPGPDQHADMDRARELGRLERDWIAPLLKRLRSGEIRHLEIATTCAGKGLRWSICSRDLWKFWKRPAPLAHPGNVTR